jgi:hypothetical protein
MFDIDRAASNSPSIDLALAFTGGGYFDYMVNLDLNTSPNLFHSPFAHFEEDKGIKSDGD